MFLFVLVCLVGRTDKKSQSSVPKGDQKKTPSRSSKEKKQGKSPKEEAASLGNAASSRTPAMASNGTERQNGRQHRGKGAMKNKIETTTCSAIGSSRQESDTVQLPWKKSQAVNGDVPGAGNDMPTVTSKAGTDSKTREETVQSSTPVNAFSNRVISKPSLPSILDIADRLNSTKI